MTNHTERDDISGTETTGHEWDGLKELDTPLPRWWLYIFYATIAVAVVYWVLMPAWPIGNSFTPGTLHFSDRRNVATDVATLQQARAPMYERLSHATPADIERDPQLQQFARAAGESAFGDHCRTCHGAGGGGQPGYPNLTDDVWLWGGSVGDIEHTIRVGIRSSSPETRMSMMPAFGRLQMLTPAQISDSTEYVISLGPAAARLHPDNAAAARGSAIYGVQCAACHGATGAGDRTMGAPSLRDDVWLYGGSREEIRKQIELGRGGVMPTWESTLDPGTIRALAFYVHELGGGEPDAPASPAASIPTNGAPAASNGAAVAPTQSPAQPSGATR
ncbi:MAG: cytochrome-c oxidase, cbb3-type subunit III [Proteobacteria bacterium]|nr:cytochrome-c oxidase, cbb3-type subunit III [Pseudomonadota bacterium]